METGRDAGPSSPLTPRDGRLCLLLVVPAHLWQRSCAGPLSSHHGVGGLLFPQWPSVRDLGAAGRALTGQVIPIKFLRFICVAARLISRDF